MNGIEACVNLNTSVIPIEACRFCLWRASPMFPLFGEVCERNRVKEKYTDVFAYPVERNDGRPTYVCVPCTYKLEMCYRFKEVIKTAHDCATFFKDALPEPIGIHYSSQIPPAFLANGHYLKMHTGHFENVVPNINNMPVVRNDVPSCSTHENIESDDINIEAQNANCDESSSIIFEPQHIESIEQHVSNMENNSIFPELQIDGSFENNSILIEHDNAAQVSGGGDDNNNTTGGDSKQEVGNRDDRGSTSASLANRSAVNGSESHPNGSAGLRSNVSNNNQRGIIKSMGKKIPDFSCIKCPEKFFTKLQLELHYCNSLSSSNISCRYCQKEFSDRTELSAHKKVHLSLFSENCRKCGEVFLSPKALRVHKNTECIARGGSRPSTPLTRLHECRICNRDFCSLAGKKLHKTSKEHRANVMKHSLKMKESRNGKAIYRKTAGEINNGTNSHPISGNDGTELPRNNSNSGQENDTQTKYSRLRRRTYSDSVWLVG